MEKVDDTGYAMAIGSILWNIENRKELSGGSKVYIDWIKEYFQEVSRTINSISHTDFIFTPHFIEVVEALACKRHNNISIEDLLKYRDEFYSINNKLENLKTNSKEFYNSEDSKYIFNFMKKIEPFFQTSHIPPMTCCGEDLDDD